MHYTQGQLEILSILNSTVQNTSLPFSILDPLIHEPNQVSYELQACSWFLSSNPNNSFTNCEMLETRGRKWNEPREKKS